MRRMLVQSASGSSPEPSGSLLQALFFLDRMRRRGEVKKAIVVVAHRIVMIIWK